MDALYAILLGIVEGLTEFLPISSTGHLIIAEHYIQFKDTAEVFTVVVQLGAIAAVIWYYRNDIWLKTKGLLSGEKSAKLFWRNIVIATFPAAVLGLALSKELDRYATPRVVAAALIIGAGVLWYADKKSPVGDKEKLMDLSKVSKKQSLIAGFAQCFALIPGTSRSGASIVGGLFGGLNRITATTFSFYMGIPILVLAGTYKLAKHSSDIQFISGGWTSIILGSIAAFVTALFAISWLLKYVSGHSFRIFVYYRIVLGVLVLLLA